MYSAIIEEIRPANQLTSNIFHKSLICRTFYTVGTTLWSMDEAETVQKFWLFYNIVNFAKQWDRKMKFSGQENINPDL